MEFLLMIKHGGPTFISFRWVVTCDSTSLNDNSSFSFD